MSHSKHLQTSLLLLVAAAIGLCVLPLSTANAQAGSTYCNPDNGCCAWVGTIEGLCCWAYDCGGSDADSGCDMCMRAKAGDSNSRVLSCGSSRGAQRHGDEAVLLSRLLARDTELAGALRSLRAKLNASDRTDQSNAGRWAFNVFLTTSMQR